MFKKEPQIQNWSRYTRFDFTLFVKSEYNFKEVCDLDFRQKVLNSNLRKDKKIKIYLEDFMSNENM